MDQKAYRASGFKHGTMAGLLWQKRALGLAGQFRACTGWGRVLLPSRNCRTLKNTQCRRAVVFRVRLSCGGGMPLVSTQVSKLPTEFALEVLEIAIVLTGAFEDVAIQHQAHLFLDLPRLGINLWVVDCNLNFHMPEIRPPKTFSDV